MAAGTLPTFSLILETENLESADLQGLERSLASLAQQDLPLTQANEVLIIDSGDTPPALLQSLQQQYPWLQMQTAPPDTTYYPAKMLGAQRVTGEIVVYADSDCRYEPHWLRQLLTSFVAHPDVQVVAGETAIGGAGPYGTAMALVYIFPQYSGDTTLRPTHQYFLNNVAFRRSYLLAHPIPTELPLYRGHCVIHAHQLQQQGDRIWQQPQARSRHAPPNGLSHFFWRFLLIGYDYYWQQQLLPATTDTATDPALQGWGGKLRIFGDRLQKMLRDKPQHLLYLPLALPIVVVAALLIYVGYLITQRRPQYLLQAYERVMAGPKSATQPT